MEEVVRTIKAAPSPDQEPAFWENFNRELHLKLAQSVPAPAPPRFSKIPYLVGAPALAALLLWVTIGYLKPDQPVLAPPAPMAKQQKTVEKMAPTPQVAAPAPETNGSIVLATQNGGEMPPDDDLDIFRDDLDTSLDTTLAGMNDKEKEDFLKSLGQHEKDGSCIRKYSAIFWA